MSPEESWSRQVCVSTRTTLAWKKIPKRYFQTLLAESEEDPDGEVLTMDQWRQLRAEVDRLDDEGIMQHETEGFLLHMTGHMVTKSARWPTFAKRRSSARKVMSKPIGEKIIMKTLLEVIFKDGQPAPTLHR